MKKTLLLVMIVGLSLFISIGHSYASMSFSNTVNFSSYVKKGNEQIELPYLELSGMGTSSSKDVYTYDYTHNVTFNPAALSIDSASITLTHSGNSNTGNGELWFLSGGTQSIYIGQLSKSEGVGNWVSDEFTLNSSLYSAINSGSWSLKILLTETTSGEDKLLISKSVLKGDYEPLKSPPAVPIPATIWLFGTGLVGLVGLRKRFKK